MGPDTCAHLGATPCDTSVVVDDGVSIDINSVYLYPSRKQMVLEVYTKVVIKVVAPTGKHNTDASTINWYEKRIRTNNTETRIHSKERNN